jgi:hypothetical protein
VQIKNVAENYQAECYVYKCAVSLCIWRSLFRVSSSALAERSTWNMNNKIGTHAPANSLVNSLLAKNMKLSTETLCYLSGTSQIDYSFITVHYYHHKRKL